MLGLALLLSFLALVHGQSTIATAIATGSVAIPPAGSGKISDPALYPIADVIAPVDTALVKQWVSELDLSNIPNIPVVAASGGNPGTKGVSADACDWTTTNCINGDVTYCPAKGVWGLTFDDGPSAFSPALYAFLKQYNNQKATLFYIGGNVVQLPDIAKQACDAGHRVGVHTWSHHPSTSLTNEQFIAEIKYTEMAIMEVCGYKPKYFRPPYGDVDNRIRALAKAMGYTTVIWDLDTNDWQVADKTMSASSVDNAVSKWIAAEPSDTTGHIVLQHEIYNETVDLAIRNIPLLAKVFQFQTVDECLGDSYIQGTNATASRPATLSASSSSFPAAIVAAAGGASAVSATESASGSKSAASNIVASWTILLGAFLLAVTRF